MTVYSYDRISGEYIGQIAADPSPLEPGKFLSPAFTTEIAPPASKAGFACCFVNGKWTYVEDHRGETIYDTSTAAAMTVTELGPIPAGYTDLVPCDDPIWTGTAWTVDVLKLKTRAVNEVQAILDATARELGFDSLHTSGLWKDSSNPERKARALALFRWGDAVWDFAEAEWSRQAAGNPTYFTLEAFLADVPAFPGVES
jgi:hypothetical protein